MLHACSLKAITQKGDFRNNGNLVPPLVNNIALFTNDVTRPHKY